MHGSDHADPPTIEPISIETAFASGLAHVETIGDVTVLIFYVDEIQPSEMGGQISRRICCKLAMPNDARDRMRRMLDNLDARSEGSNIARRRQDHH